MRCIWGAISYRGQHLIIISDTFLIFIKTETQNYDTLATLKIDVYIQRYNFVLIYKLVSSYKYTYSCEYE